jgi:hypothetical protein
MLRSSNLDHDHSHIVSSWRTRFPSPEWIRLGARSSLWLLRRRTTSRLRRRNLGSDPWFYARIKTISTSGGWGVVHRAVQESDVHVLHAHVGGEEGLQRECSTAGEAVEGVGHGAAIRVKLSSQSAVGRRVCAHA